jgi:Na+/H+ antiporter NhaD/arsenite permease-like protein
MWLAARVSYWRFLDEFHWHGFSAFFKKLMVVPFIALIVVIVGLIWFFAGAVKRKAKGKDLGETERRG